MITTTQLGQAEGGGTNFRARYDGHCSECGEPIHVGDTVTYRDHVLCHEDCPCVYCTAERSEDYLDWFLGEW